MTTPQDQVRLPGDTTSQLPIADAGGFGCAAAAAAALIGQMPSQALGTRALELTGAQTLRWIMADSAVTLDDRPERLNIYINAAYRVERITCG